MLCVGHYQLWAIYEVGLFDLEITKEITSLSILIVCVSANSSAICRILPHLVHAFHMQI